MDWENDSTPFANELDSIGSFDTGYSSPVIGIVADGWEVGTWGSTDVMASIDSTQSSPAQKLTIYNYSGDPNERITDSSRYLRSAAYIKSTGYALETSYATTADDEELTTHYILSLWLKAEGPFVPQYTGRVFIDVATNLSTGNESTYTLIARRTLENPSDSWRYYVLNFAAPISGLDSTSENGIMIWANNNGYIWMDSAELISMGQPDYLPLDTFKLDTVGLEVNHTYSYALTAVDRSWDANKDDGYIYTGNEGTFLNIMTVATDEKAPWFDSMYTAIWDSTPWLTVFNTARIFKTGTTPTMRFMEGATPARGNDPVTGSSYVVVQYGDNGLIFDSDNLFKDGDFLTFRMRLLNPIGFGVDTTIEVGGQGGIDVRYNSLDAARGQIAPAGSLETTGEYTYWFRISTQAQRGAVPQVDDTPYNTVTSMYESLYKVNFFAKDSQENGPNYIDFSDLEPADNNPDSTYLVIIDNSATDAPGMGEGEEQ